MAMRKYGKSIVDRRMKELEKEMAILNAEIKSISKKGVTRDVKSLVSGSSRKQVFSSQDERSSGHVGDSTPGSKFISSREPSNNESTTTTPPEKVVNVQSQLSYNENNSGENREKFVSYFAAGNLHDLRPMRQNDNVLRNKAIMMAVLAALAIFALVFHMLGR